MRRSFLTTATVMAVIDSDDTESAAAATVRAALGIEIDLDVSHPGGFRLTALTLDGTPVLDQVGGRPFDELCKNEDCRDSLDAGERYGGECGNCADRTYSAEFPDEGVPEPVTTLTAAADLIQRAREAHQAFLNAPRSSTAAAAMADVLVRMAMHASESQEQVNGEGWDAVYWTLLDGLTQTATVRKTSAPTAAQLNYAVGASAAAIDAFMRTVPPVHGPAHPVTTSAAPKHLLTCIKCGGNDVQPAPLKWAVCKSCGKGMSLNEAMTCDCWGYECAVGGDSADSTTAPGPEHPYR